MPGVFYLRVFSAGNAAQEILDRRYRSAFQPPIDRVRAPHRAGLKLKG
jgi:hypothetical protein